MNATVADGTESGGPVGPADFGQLHCGNSASWVKMSVYEAIRCEHPAPFWLHFIAKNPRETNGGMRGVYVMHRRRVASPIID